MSTKLVEQETSLDQQEYDSVAFAEKMGYHVVHKFRVQETASKASKRVVFNQMVNLLRSETVPVRIVIFKSPDRSSRNKLDKVRLDELRAKYGVILHYYASGKTLSGDSHYSDEFVDDFESVVAVQYAREHGQKIASAYKHKALVLKKAVGVRPPMGYKFNKETRSFVIDEETSHKVRALHTAFDTGAYSLGKFVEHCNSNHLFPESGIPWTKGRMEKLLKNPFYCGWFRFKGAELQGSHPAYITRERFVTRLKRLNQRQNGIVSNRRNHFLSRFVRCEVCGRSYEGETQHGAHDSGEYNYLKHKCPKRRGAVEHRIKESQVFIWLDEIVEYSRFHPHFTEALKEIFRKPLKIQKRSIQTAMAQLDAQMSRIASKRMRLLDLYADELINKAELRTKHSELDAEMRLLQNERAAVAMNNDNIFDQIVETIDLLREIPIIFLQDTFEGKIKVLRKLADFLVISPDGKLELKWVAPYSFLMKAEILELQANGRIEPLKKHGFKKVSVCARRGT